MNTFTLVHILISLAGIAAGFVALGGWLVGRSLPVWTGLFLAATVLTSVTGFFLPLSGFTPAVAVGILSLLVLAVALYALLARKLAGRWRTVFVITSVVALYFNFFVLVAQLFQKTPALKALAPTQAEPPFAIAQLLVLVLFIALGFGATRGMRAAA